MYVQMRPHLHLPSTVSSCTGTRVSSVWMTFDSRTLAAIRSTSGWTNSPLASIQAHMVLAGDMHVLAGEDASPGGTAADDRPVC